MNNDVKRLHELKAQGYCCTQIMVKLGLEARREENEQMVDVLAALCGGLHTGLLCGALSGAACLLYMFDKRNAVAAMIPELVEWFEETYGSVYGGTNCVDIIGEDKSRKPLCPNLMEATYLKAKEILNEYGFDLDCI